MRGSWLRHWRYPVRHIHDLRNIATLRRVIMPHHGFEVLQFILNGFHFAKGFSQSSLSSRG
jgi:hypothetical protein